MADHHHKWQGLNQSRLVCHGCDTIANIDVVLANTATAAAKQSKIDVLASQLYAGELRKDAHDKYYAWVMQNNPDAIKRNAEQGSLL